MKFREMIETADTVDMSRIDKVNERYELGEVESTHKVSLEDGTMFIEVRRAGEESFQLEIEYEGNKCKYIASDSIEATNASGDVATILNALVQDLFIHGVVKSK